MCGLDLGALDLVYACWQAVTAGANPITLKKGIDKTCDFLVKKLKELARPVKGTEDIRVRTLVSSTAGLSVTQ
jgi:chaperonin GroEL (HSP60 family)